MRKVRAWWIAPSDGLLAHRDSRVPQVGVTHRVEGNIEFCVNGLHASVLPLDALHYRRGVDVYRVELGGVVLTDKTKLVASERKYLARVPGASEVLRRFARLCALDVLHLWDAPAIVEQYLKTGDRARGADAAQAAYAFGLEQGGAAYAAAYAAEVYAVGAHAAYTAANAAAYAAEVYAAAAAAFYGAHAAGAAAAAADANYKAVYSKQNARLHRMFMEAIRKGRKA